MPRSYKILTFFCLIIILLVGGCSPASKDKTPWAIYIYMAADNGLSDAAWDDIAQMEEAVYDHEAVRVVVQVDFYQDSSYSGAERFVIEHHPEAGVQTPVLTRMGEIDSGSPRTLNRFLDWAATNYPGEQSALVLWSHGNGWQKRTDPHFCPDAQAGTWLNVAGGDLRAALGDHYYDLLVFDACSMGTVEVMGECAANADYILAAEDDVPTKGFPYNTFLADWELPEANAARATRLAADFIASYDAGGFQNVHGDYIVATMSALDCHAYLAFCDSLTALVAAEPTPSSILGWQTARSQVHEFNLYNGENEVDILQLLDKLAATSTPVASRAASLAGQVNNTWIARCYLNYPYNDVGTATLWYPDTANALAAQRDKYSGLLFAGRGWLGFLDRLYTDRIR